MAPPLKGWQVEVEVSDTPPGPKQPHIKGADGSRATPRHARVRYRKLPCHFEATWSANGKLEDCTLRGSLLRLTATQWRSLWHGLKLIGELQNKRGRPVGTGMYPDRQKFDDEVFPVIWDARSTKIADIAAMLPSGTVQGGTRSVQGLRKQFQDAGYEFWRDVIRAASAAKDSK